MRHDLGTMIWYEGPGRERLGDGQSAGMVTIYHNPRCAKSRATLKLLEERGLEPRIVRYLDDPPSLERLRELVGLLGRRPIELTRTKEPLCRELGLTPATPDEEVLVALAAHPALLERPIVVHGDRAALGRPPEAVLDLF